MGMIQIDMPMPDNCLECRFNPSEFWYCNAMPENFCGIVNEREEDGKPEWCPLKAQESCMDAVSREAVLDLAQTYGPATYDMPYGSGDMIIRPEDVKALPSVQPTPLARATPWE